MSAVAGEELRDGGINKLGAIVGLHGNDREVELCACKGNEVAERVGRVRFPTKRKHPHVVREVVNNNKIVLKTRITKNRRCPQITMN